MLAQLTGIYRGRTHDAIILDVMGLGFLVHPSGSVVRQLPPVGSTLLLETLLLIRQEAPVLFGFSTLAEKECFEILLNVQGVGPKVGLALLSAFDLKTLVWVLESGDEKTLTKVEGVGPKLARRLITELKDKLSVLSQTAAGVVVEASLMAGASALSLSGTSESPVGMALPACQEALLALEGLGYDRAQAYAVLQKMMASTHDSATTLSTSDIIRQALRELSPLMKTLGAS